MSHTSSSRRATRQGAHAIRRFNLGVASTVAVSVVATTLALLGYALQGPRLRDATIDLVRSVGAPHSVLRVESDRPLDQLTPDQVSVHPSVDVDVQVQGSLAAVVFLEALDYGTDYRVEITGVKGVGRAAEANWTYEFRTPSAQLFYLDRGGAAEEDRILSVGVDTESPREIYRANGIDVFVPIGSTLLVFGSEGDGSIARLVEPVSGNVERLVLPGEVRVDQVFAPASGTRVAFTVSSLDGGEYDRTLFVVDAAGSRRAAAIAGLDGEQLRVTKAAVVPASDTLIAWVDDIRVVSIDLRTGLVLPLAEEATELWGVSSRGDQAVLVDIGGTVAIGLSGLEETRVLPALLAGREVFEGQTLMLSGGNRIQTVVLGNPQGTDFTSLVAKGDDTGLEILYRTPEDRGSIGALIPSPSDRFLAIETIPNRATRQSDARALEPRDISSTIAVIDVDSGELVRTVQGVWPVWMR